MKQTLHSFMQGSCGCITTALPEAVIHHNSQYITVHCSLYHVWGAHVAAVRSSECTDLCKMTLLSLLFISNRLAQDRAGCCASKRTATTYGMPQNILSFPQSYGKNFKICKISVKASGTLPNFFT